MQHAFEVVNDANYADLKEQIELLHTQKRSYEVENARLRKLVAACNVGRVVSAAGSSSQTEADGVIADGTCHEVDEGVLSLAGTKETPQKRAAPCPIESVQQNHMKTTINVGAASSDGVEFKKMRFSSDGDSAGCEEVQRLRVENEELKKELSAANATVEQMVSVIVCFPSLGSADGYFFQTDPFSIRIPLLNRMKDFVCVTHVTIDVEKLDASIVAFVENAVDREVPQVSVMETVNNYGDRRVERDLLHDEFSVQGKKLEAGGAQAEESISKLKRLKTLTDMEKEAVDGSLKQAQAKIKELNKELDSEQKKVLQLRSESESLKEQIKKLELQVIRFCRARLLWMTTDACNNR